MSFEFWQDVVSSNLNLPRGHDFSEAAAELVRMLGEPDPRIRDDHAYVILTGWIHRGDFDGLLGGLGDGILPGLRYGLGRDGDLSVLRRSYSALVLAEILCRDYNAHALPASTVLAWGDRITGWFVREADHRGWLGEQGWAHAIAHGADALAGLARSRHFGPPELTVLLDVVADRVLAPTPYAWHHGEHDRLAYAVTTVLHRNALDTSVVEPWLNRLGAAIRTPPTRGPAGEWPSPAVHNTSMLLRALHLQLALGVQGREDLLDDVSLFGRRPAQRADLILAVLDQIRGESPWLYRRTSRTEPDSH